MPEPELLRPRLDAIDAEQAVEQGAHEGQAVTNSDPTERRLCTALAQQRVAGRKRAQEKTQRREQAADELGLVHELCNIDQGRAWSQTRVWPGHRPRSAPRVQPKGQTSN